MFGEYEKYNEISNIKLSPGLGQSSPTNLVTSNKNKFINNGIKYELFYIPFENLNAKFANFNLSTKKIYKEIPDLSEVNAHFCEFETKVGQ